MPNDLIKQLQTSVLICAVLAIAAGATGMVFSFMFLSSATMADITAGAAGFVAGSVLIAAGLLSVAILAACGQRQPSSQRPGEEET